MHLLALAVNGSLNTSSKAAFISRSLCQHASTGLQQCCRWSFMSCPAPLALTSQHSKASLACSQRLAKHLVQGGHHLTRRQHASTAFQLSLLPVICHLSWPLALQSQHLQVGRHECRPRLAKRLVQGGHHLALSFNMQALACSNAAAGHLSPDLPSGTAKPVLTGLTGMQSTAR